MALDRAQLREDVLGANYLFIAWVLEDTSLTALIPTPTTTAFFVGIAGVTATLRTSANTCMLREPISPVIGYC